MGAIARAMAVKQVATEAAYQPIAEPTQAKEVAANNSDNDSTRQTRQGKEKHLDNNSLQDADLYSINPEARQLDRLDGFQGLDKVKAANDELEVNLIDTTSGLNEADKVKPTGNVVTKEVNGIKLPMPEHYYKGENLTFWMSNNEQLQQEQYGDGSWIELMLLKLPASKRAQLSREYSARYKAAYDAEPDNNKKANKAALAANSWLRSNIK